MSKIKVEILQKMIDGGGKYFLVNRYVEGMGASRGKDEWYAMVISPNVPRDLWGKKIMELPYKEVVDFSESDLMTNIHLGKTYQPFQYGIKNGDFIDLIEITCRPMELVIKCYEENITDYYKAKEIMKSLTKED